MTSCRTFNLMVERARDGALPPADASALQAHAERCAPCAHLLRLEACLRAGLAQVRRARAETPVPATFTASVHAAARRAAPAPQAPRRGAVLAWVGVAATILLGALVVLGPFRDSTSVPDRAAGPDATPAAVAVSARQPVDTRLLWGDGTMEVVAARTISSTPRPARGTAPRDGVPASKALLVEWSF
jgi:anti-sigma factor RsiW